MKRFLLILTLTLMGSQIAQAYEFKLQFTPSGGTYGLKVAGYEFNGSTIVGDCSYYTVSLRGTTWHYNICTWNRFGHLISLTPVSSPPVAPRPLSHTGTEIVYAVSGTSRTGYDTRGFGFVNTPSSHYSWHTPNGVNAAIPYAAVNKVTATLISDGDFPLDFDGANVATHAFGTPAYPGTATVSRTTCPSGSQLPDAKLAVGSKCSVTVSYDALTIPCTSSTYGYAYTGMELKLVTDAGTNTDFTEWFTITGVPTCGD